MEDSMDSAKPVFEHEYSIFYRTSRGGAVGPLRRKYLLTASATLQFLGQLRAGSSPVLITIARREVGSWEHVEHHDVEDAAAQEGENR
jgi:hypothetical protein